jgi:hypothetical protein
MIVKPKNVGNDKELSECPNPDLGSAINGSIRIAIQADCITPLWLSTPLVVGPALVTIPQSH